MNSAGTTCCLFGSCYLHTALGTGLGRFSWEQGRLDRSDYSQRLLPCSWGWQPETCTLALWKGFLPSLASILGDLSLPGGPGDGRLPPAAGILVPLNAAASALVSGYWKGLIKFWFQRDEWWRRGKSKTSRFDKMLYPHKFLLISNKIMILAIVWLFLSKSWFLFHAWCSDMSFSCLHSYASAQMAQSLLAC